MSNDKNYYKVLGVNYASSPMEIKRAYVKLSKKYAPICYLWDRIPMCSLKRIIKRIVHKCALIHNLVSKTEMEKYMEVKQAYDVLRLRPKESDLYKRLGVERTASTDDIKRAYRRCVRKFHPSVSPYYEGAKERLEEITEAFNILHNPEKRKLYDRYGAEADYSEISSFEKIKANFLGFHSFEEVINYMGSIQNFGQEKDEQLKVEQLLPVYPYYFGKGRTRSTNHVLLNKLVPTPEDLNCAV